MVRWALSLVLWLTMSAAEAQTLGNFDIHSQSWAAVLFGAVAVLFVYQLLLILATHSLEQLLFICSAGCFLVLLTLELKTPASEIHPLLNKAWIQPLLSAGRKIFLLLFARRLFPLDERWRRYDFMAWLIGPIIGLALADAWFAEFALPFHQIFTIVFYPGLISFVLFSTPETKAFRWSPCLAWFLLEALAIRQFLQGEQELIKSQTIASTYSAQLLELLLLSFASNKKIRAAKQSHDFKIAQLNATLQTTNTELEKRLQQIQEQEYAYHLEVETKNILVSELAHRGNNPLQASDLAILNMRDDTKNLGGLIDQLFGHPEELEEDGRICLEAFRTNLKAITEEQNNLRTYLSRFAQVIAEIRTLSGIDGQNLEFVPLGEALLNARDRLADSVGDKEMSRLHIHIALRGEDQVASNNTVLILCFEQLFRGLLAENSGLISFNVCRKSEPHHIHLELLSEHTEFGKNALMIARLDYILHPYHMSLQLSPQQRALILINHPIEETLILRETAPSTKLPLAG